MSSSSRQACNWQESVEDCMEICLENSALKAREIACLASSSKAMCDRLVTVLRKGKLTAARDLLRQEILLASGCSTAGAWTPQEQQQRQQQYSAAARYLVTAAHIPSDVLSSDLMRLFTDRSVQVNRNIALPRELAEMLVAAGARLDPIQLETGVDWNTQGIELWVLAQYKHCTRQGKATGFPALTEAVCAGQEVPHLMQQDLSESTVKELMRLAINGCSDEHAASLRSLSEGPAAGQLTAGGVCDLVANALFMISEWRLDISLAPQILGFLLMIPAAGAMGAEAVFRLLKYATLVAMPADRELAECVMNSLCELPGAELLSPDMVHALIAATVNLHKFVARSGDIMLHGGGLGGQPVDHLSLCLPYLLNLPAASRMTMEMVNKLIQNACRNSLVNVECVEMLCQLLVSPADCTVETVAVLLTATNKAVTWQVVSSDWVLQVADLIRLLQWATKLPACFDACTDSVYKGVHWRNLITTVLHIACHKQDGTACQDLLNLCTAAYSAAAISSMPSALPMNIVEQLLVTVHGLTILSDTMGIDKKEFLVWLSSLPVFCNHPPLPDLDDVIDSPIATAFFLHWMTTATDPMDDSMPCIQGLGID